MPINSKSELFSCYDRKSSVRFMDNGLLLSPSKKELQEGSEVVMVTYSMDIHGS